MSISKIKEENKIDIREIEKMFYSAVLAAGRAAMAEYLEKLDDSMAVARDKKEYRDKGKRPTVLKTIMGEVENNRRVYTTEGEAGENVCVYLLDELLRIDTPGLISPMLSELVATAACESTYRETARQVSELTGQTISHQTAWSITQEVGTRVRMREEELAEQAQHNTGPGKLESKILYEEADGIWLKLQGKDRKTYGPSKEMKAAIAYSGVKQNGKRRRLADKVACASFAGVKDFIKRKEGVIASIYRTSEIELRILNGDGANWITANNEATVVYQLDPFHRNKAIQEYVNDPELRKLMMDLLYAKEIDSLLAVIEASINSTMEPEEQEKRQRLLGYFKNNKEGLVPYYRRSEKLPPVNKGLKIAHGGSMESNIFTLIGNRMKGRRANWSVRGANNMAALLCLKHTGRLSSVLTRLGPIVSLNVEQITAEFSSSKVPERVGKGYNGFTHAPIPNMPWIKDILGMKSLAKMPFLAGS
jgi:hypothetical protein